MVSNESESLAQSLSNQPLGMRARQQHQQWTSMERGARAASTLSPSPAAFKESCCLSCCNLPPPGSSASLLLTVMESLSGPLLLCSENFPRSVGSASFNHRVLSLRLMVQQSAVWGVREAPRSLPPKLSKREGKTSTGLCCASSAAGRTMLGSITAPSLTRLCALTPNFLACRQNDLCTHIIINSTQPQLT